MKKSHVFSLSKILLIPLILVLVSGNGLARIKLNGSGGGFWWGGGGTYSFSTNTKYLINEKIEERVIRAAAYFLKSYSKFLAVLNQVELSDIEPVDTEGLYGTLYAAFKQMAISKNAYKDLVKLAKRTQYNPKVIAELENFDYEGFAEVNNFDEDMFEEVSDFLEDGELREIYEVVFQNTKSIFKDLKKISKRLSKGKLPKTEDLWDINGKYKDSFLFGQYVAEVFKEILY